MAVSFNYLWQWASWILIILSLVFPGAPRHSFQQHDALTRSSPLHPKLIGFFLSSPDIFCESKVIISWAEDVGRQRDSHASDSGDVIWLFCREWSFSHCVQSHGGDSYDWPGQLQSLWTESYIMFIILRVWTGPIFKFGWQNMLLNSCLGTQTVEICHISIYLNLFHLI